MTELDPKPADRDCSFLRAACEPVCRRGTAMRPGCSRSLLALAAVLLASPLVLSAGQPAGTGEIPPLRPPIGEVEPGTWERNGTRIILGAGIVLMLGAGAVTRLLRPKPVPPEAPAVLVRAKLTPLKGQPQDPAALSLVSRAFRAYLAAVYKLPQGELTTAEFLQSLGSRVGVARELAGPVGEFLRRCDREKFAQRESAPSWDAASEALRLVDTAEAQRRAEASPRQAA